MYIRLGQTDASAPVNVCDRFVQKDEQEINNSLAQIKQLGGNTTYKAKELRGAVASAKVAFKQFADKATTGCWKRAVFTPLITAPPGIAAGPYGVAAGAVVGLVGGGIWAYICHRGLSDTEALRQRAIYTLQGLIAIKDQLFADLDQLASYAKNVDQFSNLCSKRQTLESVILELAKTTLDENTNFDDVEQKFEVADQTIGEFQAILSEYLSQYITDLTALWVGLALVGLAVGGYLGRHHIMSGYESAKTYVKTKWNSSQTSQARKRRKR